LVFPDWFGITIIIETNRQRNTYTASGLRHFPIQPTPGAGCIKTSLTLTMISINHCS
jgi:hypothetical protein